MHLWKQMGLWIPRLIPAESSTSGIRPPSSIFIFLSLNLPSFSRPVNIDVAILSGSVLFLCSKGSKQPRRKLPLRSLPCLSGSGMATSLSAPEAPQSKGSRPCPGRHRSSKMGAAVFPFECPAALRGRPAGELWPPGLRAGGSAHHP